MSRLSVTKRVEKAHGRTFKDVLRDYAVDQKMPPEQIAGTLGCGMQAFIKAAAGAGFRVVRRLEPIDKK